MEGIVPVEGGVWMDPVAVLSTGYSHHELCRTQYYARSAAARQIAHQTEEDQEQEEEEEGQEERPAKRRRKRRRKKALYAPNEKERLAELRHQEARGAMLVAHSSFLATALEKVLSQGGTAHVHGISHGSRSDSSSSSNPGENLSSGRDELEDHELDFCRLAEVWQAPLYELTVFRKASKMIAGGTSADAGEAKEPVTTHPLFNALIELDDGEEATAKCAGASFVIPSCCRFLISDIAQARLLIPGDSRSGYNLIVIDPPWENKSVRRNSLYEMIPNRQFCSLPIKQLAHREGALVALWMTNREKLHQFVKKELFSSWGVTLTATWYWLKLTGTGEMISPLDLQHHKPYECLLLGYVDSPSLGNTEKSNMAKGNGVVINPPEKFVIMSVPGDHSRKPPMGSLLAQYTPGLHPIKGIELFARELNAGWTSWGNEALHFQHSKYFWRKS